MQHAHGKSEEREDCDQQKDRRAIETHCHLAQRDHIDLPVEQHESDNRYQRSDQPNLRLWRELFNEFGRTHNVVVSSTGEGTKSYAGKKDFAAKRHNAAQSRHQMPSNNEQSEFEHEVRESDPKFNPSIIGCTLRYSLPATPNELIPIRT